MKFVTLALAFLLAAGCQSNKLQADAPSQYEHIRAGVVTYLTQLKESAHQAVNQLDDAEFKDYKARFTKGLDNIEAAIKYAAESLAPVRTGAGPQIVEFISSIRETFSHDLKELGKELQPKQEELYKVIKKHLEEYKTLLEPVVKDYNEKNQQLIEDFRTKVQPVFDQLKAKFSVNLEETKSKLTPIVETIRDHLANKFQELKTAYGPHAQEYREQIELAYADVRQKYESGKLQENLKKLVEELKPQLKGIYETIEKAFKE
ncbi:apolipoprotein A-I-2-like [Neoarius graeffei]|uniref:apolipoprotein A-I-2-like n=1 Tax=Neoarius graeffei TaxID=443677 RepID=UPI00298D1E30|nr:apolipoprotein A-I-2-like [Neoarius graeffei]